MAHLLHKYHSSALFLGIGMLMLFSFCAPAYASDAPATPTFRSTSPFGINQTIKEPATVNINGIHQGTIYKPFSSDHPFAELDPGSGSGGGSSNDDDDIGIGGWVDTPSEPLPIGDGMGILLLMATMMVGAIFLKQRKQLSESISKSTTSTTNINNLRGNQLPTALKKENNTTQHMTTRKQTYQSLRQKLFLLLAFVCAAGQVSADKTIYFRPGTTNFSHGYDVNDGQKYESAFWIKNGYIAMAIHNPSTANTQYIETGRHRSKILDTDVSKRFLSMVVPEGYTQIAAYRLKDIATDDLYTTWRESPNNSKIQNRIPTKGTTTNFIDIPTDGKNLLVHYEGYWNKWYWAYYLPTNNDVFIYFANTGNWSNVKMLTGKDIYTFPTAEFGTIKGTKLRYLSLTGNEYGYTNYGFINSNSDNLSKGWDSGLIPPICSSDDNNDYHAFNGNRNGSNGDEGVTANQTYNKNNTNATKKLYDIKVNKLSENLIANRIKNAPNYTGLREDLLEGINVFTPSSTNGSAVDKKTITSWQDLNHTHTVTIETGGKLNYGAYQLCDETTSQYKTGINKTGSIPITITAAYTGTIILRAIPDDGYVFLGFYDQESNKLLGRGTEEEFTYNKITYKYTYDAPNSSQKIIAKFGKGNTTRNFLVRTMIYDNGLKNSLDGGTFTITHSGGNTYTYTTQAEGTDYQEMYVSDAPMTLTANPKSGYEFIAWFNMDHDKRYPENPWTIADPMNTTKYKQKFTAVFASTDYAKRQNINIKGPGYVDINYVFYEDGTSKTNTFYKNYSFIAWINKDVTLTATPTPGYSFVGWYEGQNLVSKDATYTYTATSNRNITAHFAEGEETTTLRVRAMVWKEDGQTVYGETGGTFTLTHSGGVVHQHQQQQKIDDYEHVVITNSPVTFSATINDGYEFIGWFNVQPDRRFLVNPWIMEDPLNISHYDDATTRYIDRFTAVFASTDYAKKQNIKFEGLGTVTANYTYYSTSTKEVVYEYNSSFIAWNNTDVTLTATPLEGYVFDGWYNSAGNKVSSDATHKYTVSEATTLTAKFKQKVHKLSVSVLNYNPEYDKFEEYGYEYNTVTLTQGSTKLKESYSSFEHTFNDETTVTLTATPEDGEDGYDFVGWFINNEKLTKEGSDKSDLYTLTSDYSNEITINLSGEVAVNAHFAPKKCWEVIIRNNIGGLFTVQYSRDANFTTYQTAESALDHYTYTHFGFGTTYVRVSPQPIVGYKLLKFKVGGSTTDAGNTISYGPTYDPEKHTTKKSQVVTNFVREDDQIVYLNLKGSGGNIPAEWNTNDPNQHSYYAFVDNSFYTTKGELQLKWIKMTHVQDYCYTCTIPGNMYNRISFVQIGKDSEGNFITNGRNDLPITTVNIDFDTIKQLSLNYVRDTLHLERRRTSLTTIPATRNNCYRLNWSWNSSTQTNDHGWTEPPTQVGDFRLVYIEQTVINKTTIREDYRFDNAGLIKKSPNTEDIISLHIYNKVSDGVNGVNNPEIILQKCTAIVDGKSQWVDIERHMVFGPLRTDDTGNIRLPGRKNSAGLIIDKGIDKIKDAVNDEDQASGVWNFVIVQDGEGGATLDLTRTAQYEGEYYIRTTNAKGQYNDYTNPDNVMTLSKYAKDNSDYSHYFIRYVDINEDGTPTSEAGKHQLVKFAIANKHSVYLNNELMVNNDRFKDDEYESDIFVRNIGGAPNLPADATVRFGWDIVTNRLTRAYIADTKLKNNEYLVVEPGTNIGSPIGEATYFTDNSNYLYSISLNGAKTGAATKVKAKMNGQYQYFLGTEQANETLISGNGANTYPIRLLYDFKDDRFTTIYQPASGTVNNDVQLTTPLMIERKHNGQATQIQLATNKITTVQAGEDQYTQPAYAVMTFLEEVLADASKTHHEKMFYWISFPFDVCIRDVFGLGDYGKYWIMEEYNGAQRAASGLAQNNWKYITKKSAILEANKGYGLCLNYSQILQDQLFKSYGSSDQELNSGKLSLYFPSNGTLSPRDITGNQRIDVNLEEHYNANTAWNHHNWHIIGVPSFADPEFKKIQQDAPFVYQYWHPGDAYAAVSINEVDFQSMHAYMVQYTGDITWTSVVNNGGSVSGGKSLAAKKDADTDKNIMLRLELQQAGSTLDKTYVQLRNDKGTKGFDMSLDLTKIINAGANIYSIVDNHEMAGNAIPKDETVLPLGVVITAAGEYTFAMPNGTEGMIVELIDYEQGTSTNLLMSDYTVNMPVGTNNTRFALRLVPEKVATSVEDITSGTNDNVRKLLIDGVLYLVKDGAVYDAQGHCVR